MSEPLLRALFKPHVLALSLGNGLDKTVRDICVLAPCDDWSD